MGSNGATIILAAFVTPGLLYAGAGAVSIPILIHLLTRRRFRRIRWAAMEFLIDAERRNRRRLRMEEWILLALRCLAVLGMGFFIARPYLSPRGVAAGFGGSRHVERVFVLDDSFSMGYQLPEKGNTPFLLAKQAVRRLVEAIRVESPEDTVTLIRTSAARDPVALRTYLDVRQTDDLFMRLDALTPSQRSMNSADVIQGVTDVLQRSPDVAGVVVYVISDFQRIDWMGTEASSSSNAETRQTASGSAAARPRDDAAQSGTGIFAPLKIWAGEDRGLKVVLVNVGETEAPNTAITSLESASGQIVAGATGRLRVNLANFSTRSVEGLGLELAVGSVPQPTQTLRELAMQQTAVLELEAQFPRTGFEAVRLQMPVDRLPIDNVRHLAIDVSNAVRILIVNGEPASEAYDNETTFLTTALRPEGELFSGNEPVVMDEAELDGANLTGFHLVVLANVYRISDPVVAALERFVRDGGGLVVFLGDQVDPELYNAAFFRDGKGILPARLGELIRAAQPARMVVTDRLHPAMRGLSGDGDPLGLGQVPFHQYFACEPFGSKDSGSAGSPTSQPDGSAPLPAEGTGDEFESEARVVARFDDSGEHPLIVERRTGSGRVILVTTSADKEWNLWPDHPTFLPVMMELMHRVARRISDVPEQLVGSTIRLPMDPAVFEADAFVRTPAYPAEAELGVTATAAEDGRGLVLQWEHTETAGFYQFVLRGRDGGEAVRMVAVNVDSRESDLAAAKEEDLRRAFPKLPFEYLKGIDALTGGTGEARTELWRNFLFATALVLIAEQFLAWFWGKRQ